MGEIHPSIHPSIHPMDVVVSHIIIPCNQCPLIHWVPTITDLRSNDNEDALIFFIHEPNDYDNFFHPWTKWLWQIFFHPWTKWLWHFFSSKKQWAMKSHYCWVNESGCVCVDEFIQHHHIVGPRMRADNDVDEFQLSWCVHHPHPSIHSSRCIGCCLGFRTL
jgi:hypothetical protein